MIDQTNSEQTEIVLEFVNEVRELIEELEPSIIGLDNMARREAELTKEDINTLNGIFRLFHSIKGGAGFLSFNNIVETTHTAENLLDKLRVSEFKLTQEHVDLLCQTCDFTKDALDYVEEHLNDKGMDDEANTLMSKFGALSKASGKNNPSAPIPETKTEEVTHPPPQDEENPPSPAPEIDFNISMEDLITPETRKKFIEEADDLIQEIEEDLLKLAKNPENLDPIERLFRNIHSFKGNCGFLGFKDLESLKHMQETILDTIKSGENGEVSRMTDMFLELIDVDKETVARIGIEGSATIDGIDLYLELLNNLLPQNHRQDLGESSTMLGDILVKQGAVSKDEIDKALETQTKTIGELLVDAGATTKEHVEKALKVQEKLRPKGTSAEGKSVSKRQDIRVDLEKLDNLINLIGEMVIAENMVIHNPDLKGLELESFNKASQHMSKIVRELQEMAMIIRMIPVSGLFRRMIRLVHDLSRKSGKKVDLHLTGEGTEVDKTVIEKITDPLVHLIRNSMDHGLESPEERQNLGKKETGSINLDASHEEGEVVIRITDDGRGLHREKLLAKGIERGLISGDGADLSDQQVYQLIFAPGFSTADKVTDISGRGVGMDVVRQNLESIKGRIEIDSTPGQGTTISLHIPLTLAIIEGMQIRTGTSHYILPILSIRESFQPTRSAITISPDGEELVKVRNNLLPVVRLHELHQIEPDHRELEKGILIVLEARHSRNICLFVDELMGQQQTVIKGLSGYLSSLGDVSGVSGCTILGNGEVCLILDVRALEDITFTPETVSVS